MLMVAAMSFYLVWSVFSQLIKWSELPFLVVAVIVSMLPVLALGYGFRRWRLKKAAELREYERVLKALANLN